MAFHTRQRLRSSIFRAYRMRLEGVQEMHIIYLDRDVGDQK